MTLGHLRLAGGDLFRASLTGQILGGDFTVAVHHDDQGLGAFIFHDQGLGHPVQVQTQLGCCFHGSAMIDIVVAMLVQRFLPQGHQPVLAALALVDAQYAIAQAQVLQGQFSQLRDAQTAGIQSFQHAAVTQAQGIMYVWCGQQALYLFFRQGMRDTRGLSGATQFQAGVVLPHTFLHRPIVKATQGGQPAVGRAGLALTGLAGHPFAQIAGFQLLQWLAFALLLSPFLQPLQILPIRLLRVDGQAVLQPEHGDEIGNQTGLRHGDEKFGKRGCQFEAEHPGTKVLTSFAASDVLLQQIVNGAPVDVFASADQKAMNKAEEAKAVDPATRKNFVQNQVVLIVPTDNPAKVSNAGDLGKAEVKRVALGNPAVVPVGRYTQAALEKAGQWDAVKQREILGQNVRQVLDYVARGEVEAGFVFATDAAIMKDKVEVLEVLKTTEPVTYPIALVQREGRNDKAQAFQDFVMSESGQQVLAKYGFAKP
uniref:Molybdate ABC transporter substrate-binding protein n=1 Tax=Steinernema glaseri TaxID=37863 RepID=A0A1I8ASY4_9BILA